jgi:gliding motility-associated-like protein
MSLKKLLLCYVLLTLISSLTDAQSWEWAKQGHSITNGTGDPAWGDRFVAIDRAGNAYISGTLAKSVIFGVDTLSLDGLYLVKYDTAGQVEWAKNPYCVGNFSYNYGADVALDNSANVFIAGTVNGTVHFDPYVLHSTYTQMCLAKYDSSGNIIWAAQSYGLDTNNPHNIVWPHSDATDKWGNVYVTGYFADTVVFGNDTLKPAKSKFHTFLAKYDVNGNALWVKQSTTINNLPGYMNISDQAYSVATDRQGNVYITGAYDDTIAFGNYTLKALSNYHTNMFLVKYDSAGNVIWATQTTQPSSSTACGESVTVEYTGNIYVTGNFQDTVLFGNTTISNFGWFSSMFLAKYNAQGNLLWVEKNADSYFDSWEGSSLVCDTLKQGGAYMRAFSVCQLAPPTDPALYTLQFGGKTIKDSLAHRYHSADVILQFDSLGNTLCASLFSEGEEDDGTSVGVDPSGKYTYTTGDMVEPTAFGSDTLTAYNDLTFIARWQTCCSQFPKPGTAIECNADTITLLANSALTYAWSNGATTSSIKVAPHQNTNYNVLKNTGTCMVDSVIQVHIDHLQAGVCCNDSIVVDSSVNLSVVTSAQASYIWSPDWRLSCNNCASPIASPMATTMYYITVTDTNGCKVIDSVLIKVSPKEVKPCGAIFVPNAFSPNGDNIDDIEYVYGGCVQALDFKIFDRWGNMVFETNDPAKGWNGTFNGKPLSTGVYDYTLVAVQSNGKSTDLKGNITLVR